MSCILNSQLSLNKLLHSDLLLFVNFKDEEKYQELENNCKNFFKLMKGIVNLKSPLEYNFEGISEIKEKTLNEDDYHHFPLTTKFISSEKTRSRHPTLQSKINDDDLEHLRQNYRFNSDTSINKEQKELHELFKNNIGSIQVNSDHNTNKGNLQNKPVPFYTNFKKRILKAKI